MSAAYEQVLVESRADWHRWLSRHHAASPGIWLVTWKKSSGRPVLSYDDIVDEAIAFGWVDSTPRTVDDERSSRLLTPRKPTSNWSKVNKARVERLTASGRMQPPGLAAVAAAKANGRWDALDTVETHAVPPDLAEALGALPGARSNWDAFPPSTKRAILEWITSARTARTRGARVELTASDAAHNVRANQWRQPKPRSD